MPRQGKKTTRRETDEKHLRMLSLRHEGNSVAHGVKFGRAVVTVDLELGNCVVIAPHDMRIGDIVAVLEQRNALVECFQADGGACTVTPVCRLKGILAGARGKFIEELNRYTLAECALPAKGGLRDGGNE